MDRLERSLRLRSTRYSMVAKAHQYVQEPQRFHLRALQLIVDGANGQHLVTLDSDSQSLACDCDHFQHEGICAHVLATQHLLGPYLPVNAVHDPFSPPN